jgi:hypothetical protein
VSLILGMGSFVSSHQELLERLETTRERCASRVRASRLSATTSQKTLTASREVRARTNLIVELGKARKLHATQCPVTGIVAYVTNRPASGSAAVDDRTLVASANLLRARLDANLSQSQLARLTGKSRREIMRWEKGVLPSHRNLVILAAALGHDPFWFLTPHDSGRPSVPDVKDPDDLSSCDAPRARAGQ